MRLVFAGVLGNRGENIRMVIECMKLAAAYMISGLLRALVRLEPVATYKSCRRHCAIFLMSVY